MDQDDQDFAARWGERIANQAVIAALVREIGESMPADRRPRYRLRLEASMRAIAKELAGELAKDVKLPEGSRGLIARCADRTLTIHLGNAFR